MSIISIDTNILGIQLAFHIFEEMLSELSLSLTVVFCTGFGSTFPKGGSLSRKIVNIYKNEDFCFPKVFSEIDFGHL
jgi:hypothetical protein